MMRRFIVVILCIVAALAVWHFSQLSSSDPSIVVQSPATPPAKTITIGWVGDMVPSSDVGYNLTAFNGVSDNLGQADLMMGNLEGTFAHKGRLSKCTYIGSMCHAFMGDPSFADALKGAGFNFVSLINNHSLDYGTEGLRDTEAELDRVGLPYIAPDKPTTSITVNGVKIGIMGLSSTPAITPSNPSGQATITNYTYIAQTVQALKKDNDIVVVVFHGGAEGSDKTVVTGAEEYEGTEDRGNVQAVAYTAINAGADLVLGDGPHVLRKVELYHTKPIAYSLGNFIGGKGRLMTPSNTSGQATSTLSLFGIFTATFQSPSTDSSTSPQDSSGQVTSITDHLLPIETNFTSVLLSKDGIPSLDPTDQSKLLLDSLSK